MTYFLLWAVFIAFVLLVVVAAITNAVEHRLHREPRGPYRGGPRP